MPPGAIVLFTDINGDGRGDVILAIGKMVVAFDGQTGRLLALVSDFNGDGISDVRFFLPDGTTKTTDGRTGVVT